MESGECTQGQPQCGDTQGEDSTRTCAQSAKCATVPIRHLCQIIALITSACLKHSGFTKLDDWTEMVSTAVHMTLFFMMERVQQLGSTNSCPTDDAK